VKVTAVLRAITRVRSLVLLALVAGSAGLWSAEAAASADAGLSSVVLSNTLPGMVVAPPGVANGPITESGLELLGLDPATASAMQAHLADGSMSGYIRTWSRQPANGDAVVIEGFQFQEAPAADAFLSGADNQLRTLSPVLGSVQSATGAVRYTMATSTTGPLQRLVFFAQGTDAFLITVRSPADDLTTVNLVSLVVRQAGRVSGSTSGSSSSGGNASMAHKAGEIFGVVACVALIIGLITIWWRPRRKSGLVTSRAPEVRGAGAEGLYPPSPAGTAAPGWLPSPANMNEQLFWNGREWAGRRRWVAGRGWVESVPARPAVPVPAHAP
jgi:hypothetical protein